MLLIGSNGMSDTVSWLPPNSAPPTPAIERRQAEGQELACARGSRPRVAQAASLSRTAAKRRPSGPRSQREHADAERARTRSAQSTRKARSPSKDTPRTVGRPTSHGIAAEEEPVLDHEVARHGREAERHQREVEALEAQGGQRHDAPRSPRARAPAASEAERRAAAERPSPSPTRRGPRTRTGRATPGPSTRSAPRATAGSRRTRGPGWRRRGSPRGCAAADHRRRPPTNSDRRARARPAGRAPRGRGGRTRRPTVSRACGRNSRATNRKMPGRLRPIRRQCSPSASANPLGAFGNQNAEPQLCTSPSAMAPANGERQAAELAEHGGAVGVHHEEREGDRLEVGPAADEDAGHHGQLGAEDPRAAGHRGRTTRR